MPLGCLLSYIGPPQAKVGDWQVNQMRATALWHINCGAGVVIHENAWLYMYHHKPVLPIPTVTVGPFLYSDVVQRQYKPVWRGNPDPVLTDCIRQEILNYTTHSQEHRHDMTVMQSNWVLSPTLDSCKEGAHFILFYIAKYESLCIPVRITQHHKNPVQTVEFTISRFSII